MLGLKVEVAFHPAGCVRISPSTASESGRSGIGSIGSSDGRARSDRLAAERCSRPPEDVAGNTVPDVGQLPRWRTKPSNWKDGALLAKQPNGWVDLAIATMVAQRSIRSRRRRNLFVGRSTPWRTGSCGAPTIRRCCARRPTAATRIQCAKTPATSHRRPARADSGGNGGGVPGGYRGLSLSAWSTTRCASASPSGALVVGGRPTILQRSDGVAAGGRRAHTGG